MKRKVSILSIFLSISICIFLLSQTIIVSPFYFVSSLFSIPRFALHSLAYANSNSDELSQLRKENIKLKELLQEMSTIKKDNTALRSQFEDTTTSSSTLLPARIVGFKGSPQNPTSFVLDQGAKSGIIKGMPVIIGKNLVGKIIDTNPYFSEAMLVTHKNFSTIALSGDHNSPGIIQGFDEFILFDHVVITDTISKNENVITKGELDKNGVGIPPDFIIGKIEKVNKSDAKPFQNATVQSLLDFNSLSTVFVIKQ